MKTTPSALQAARPLDQLLAFQPVYARNQDVAAYDLLLESEARHDNLNADSLERLNEQLLECYTGTRRDAHNRRLPTLLKVAPEILVNAHLPELPRGHYIFEFPWQPHASAEFVLQLQHLAEKSYRLSISGFGPGSDENAAILNTVHMARLDVGQLGTEATLATASRLRLYSLDLLASNLQGREQFRACFAAGFHLFHGNIFGPVTHVSGRKIANNKVVLLQLLAELQKPNAIVGNLEAITIKDPELTYRILRVVSSASFGLGREIETLSQAITMLGTEQLRRWIVLFLADNEADRPVELTRVMLARGRMCEILAEILGLEMTLGHFMVGLLSQLDVLMDMEMETLMEQVPLNQEIRAALLHRRGILGELLSEVEHYEAGRFDALKDLVPRQYYEVAYRHSNVWAEQTLRAMEGTR